MNPMTRAPHRLKLVVDRVARGSQALEQYVRHDDGAVVLPLERVVQLDGYSCGVQSAYMVLRYHGRARSINGVLRQLDTGTDGTSAAALTRLFRARGLTVGMHRRARFVDIERRIDAGTPLVVSLYDGGHWVVVYGYSRQHVYVADPLCTRASVVVPRARFRAKWDRWVMAVGRPQGHIG